jgi:PilZ domain
LYRAKFKVAPEIADLCTYSSAVFDNHMDAQLSNSAGADLKVNDRRRYPRYTVRLPIEIRHKGAAFSTRGETSDVSLSGFYYPTMMQMPRGTELYVTLTLGDTQLVCNAIVRTADPGVGNGIEFLRMDEGAYHTLAEYFAELDRDSSQPGTGTGR